MSGTLLSSMNVSIGVDGEFDGDIRAKKVVISGRVDGTIDAERLEIVSTGRVTGEITATELVIEPGGSFSGTSHTKSQEHSEPRRLSHHTESPDHGDSPAPTDPETRLDTSAA